MKKLFFSLCLFCQAALSQNNYGEFTYPHSNASIMSSGITSTVAGQAGFIMASYNPNAAPYHFSIDRTNMGGALTPGSFVFQKEYNVYADLSGNCAPTNTIPVTSSHAVSIIQTPLSAIGARYALVGAFDEGCYLCFLDLSGSVINTNIFWFPFPTGTNPSTITKPIIKEDPANLGEYFICGGYSNMMYAINIDYTGTVGWSSTYQIDGRPNDMLVNSGSDMVIVGQTTTLNAVPDGFVMNLAGPTGVVNFFRVYDNSNYYQNFSCVAPTSTPALGSYIIGGACEVSPGTVKAYNLNVDGGGNKNWDNVIYSNADATAGDFVGIIERNANLAGFIEYYGIMTSTVGIIVSKMDFLGVPTYTGPGSPLDEFVYNSPGVNLTATGISNLNNVASYDVGLHIFGTDVNGSTPAPYLTQAYFSGQSGCNTPAFHFSSTNSVCAVTSPTLNPGSGLAICNAIRILDGPSSSKTDYCGPNSSLANGSNARLTGINEFSKETEKNLSVFANPKENGISVKCQNCGEISSIWISNLLGQQLYSLTNTAALAASLDSEKVLLNNLNLQNGTYLLTVKTLTGAYAEKFMYTSE